MESAVLKKNTWGGARAGAGAPMSPRTLETQKMRELMLKQLKPRAKELFDALIDSAIGLRVVKEVDGGEEFVYSKAPDVNAARLLLEHTVGKPKETVQHQGGLSVLALIRSLNESNASIPEE